MSGVEAAWRRRFRAPQVSLPHAPPEAPGRCVYATSASGVWQLATWDLDDGQHRTITDKPTGVRAGQVSPDGTGVVWFDDGDGDEVGRYVVTPFEGGAARDLLGEEVAEGWAAGLAQRPGRTVAGLADRDGFHVWVDDAAGLRRLDDFSHPLGVADLSPDGRLVAIEHAEHGDVLHPSTRVYDAVDGRCLLDLGDADATLVPVAFSPVPGDTRLALAGDHHGRLLPELVDVATGERRVLGADLPGEVDLADFWPDGRRVLLRAEHEGRSTLAVLDLERDALTPLEVGPGTVGGALVRPDGAVWYRFGSAAEPARPRVRDTVGDRVLLAPEGEPAPPGSPYHALRYPNEDGEEVHAFLALPDGQAPFPLVVEVHGGPAAHVSDHLDPYVQAWVDHGFAVLQPNYRGSTGFGKAWEERLIGDPGGPELADLRCGRDHLVADGLADPGRVVLAGASWGGYLTLLGLGTQPESWSLGVATVPVADYLSAYRDESPDLQAYDRGLFGGSPEELPALYRERSPLTHVDGVAAPVLVITGANDTRCPLPQVEGYVAALAERGVDHHFDVFEAGHGSLAVDEQIRQQGLALAFAAARLGTPGPR